MALAWLGTDPAININATSQAAPLPKFGGSPLWAAGDLLLVVLLGTPDTSIDPTPSASVPGFSRVGGKMQDVATLDTDLWVDVWWREATGADSDPTVTVTDRKSVV